jgi:hypothetical protein
MVSTEVIFAPLGYHPTRCMSPSALSPASPSSIPAHHHPLSARYLPSPTCPISLIFPSGSSSKPASRWRQAPHAHPTAPRLGSPPAPGSLLLKAPVNATAIAVGDMGACA